MELHGFKGTLKRNVPLAPLTTWRIGGPAELLALPDDLQDLMMLLTIGKAKGLQLHLLGRGSNVLIDDAGLPGITLQLGRTFQYVKVEGDRLRVGGAVAMPYLARYTASLGFAGFEHLVGIPGTVGAGVTINAGKGTVNGVDMGTILESATFISPNLEVITENVQNLGLAYRSSRLKDTRAIVVEARFRLTKADDPVKIQARLGAILAERRAKFPLNQPNAGSVFKRPVDQPPAGWLIEKAGLKGYCLGDAQISPIHANFIVNRGRAAAEDVRKLIDIVIEKVLQAHKIVLEREIVFLPESRHGVDWYGLAHNTTAR